MRNIAAVLAVALALLPWVPASAESSASDFGWMLNHTKDGGGKYALTPLSAERYILTGTRTDAACKVARAIVSRKVAREMWTQNVVMFSVRSMSGRLVRIIPEVYWSGGGKARPRRARSQRLFIRDSAWHNVTLSLGADYGLPDAGVFIGDVGLEIDIENWNPENTGGIEIKNMRVCGAGEVSFAGMTEETFKIVPPTPVKGFTAAPDALRVFFAFDNEDEAPTMRIGRHFSRKVPLILDAQQYGGFREELVKDLGGRVTYQTTLEDADAIVYSRCRPDAVLASNIVRAVTARGVPLYAASEIADAEIRALLPCEIGTNISDRLPPRARLSPTSSGAGLAKGLSDATFGIYRTCRAKPRAKVLLSFADGTPAVVEGRAGKGRVAYSMTAIGQTLVPGRRSYDAFFARMLSHLTGRALPEDTANLFAPDAEGWYRGVGTADAGRFGWEFASGLLVEDLGGTLRVVKGDGEYAFRPADDSAARTFTFAPSGVTSLSMGGDVAVDGRPFARLDASLAYPGTRWDIKASAVRFEHFGFATHVAIPLNGGIRIFAADAHLPPPKTWREPWMLLFRNDVPCEPMLVTFGRRLAALEPLAEDGALAGYVLRSPGSPVGVVVVTWPWGNVKTTSAAWAVDGLPVDAQRRIALWYPRAFTYPVRLTERFRRSPDGARFDICDEYGYAETEDEWNTPHRLFAPVPPYAYFTDGSQFSSRERLTTRLHTRTGPYADVEGRRVTWSLPAPRPDLSLLPHTRGFDRYDAIANETFRKGVRFSSGGGTLFEARNKVYPAGNALPEMQCWNMHHALLGICRALPNPFGLDAGNRAAFERRIARRLMEPLETHTYKMTTRWRRDPMSGVRYTIYMNSPRDVFAAYEPETFGSKFLYGDSNETIRMIAAAVQMLADRHGQYGAAKANRETLLRHVASYAFAFDCWLNMSAGCIERGSSYSIDMLNTEYGGMCSFARLAEICGDRDAREHFLFRAARRAVPTIARLTFPDYLKASGILADIGDTPLYSTGCGEQGPRPVRPTSGGRIRDVILYDMSQGICQDLLSLYGRYAGNELRRRYFPQVRAATVENGLNWIMCGILAVGDDLQPAELVSRMEQVAASEEVHRRLCRDWPGMDTSSYLEYVYAYLAGTPHISDCRDVNLHDAVYDPATGELTLDFTPGPEAALAVSFGGRCAAAIDVSRAGERRRTVWKPKKGEAKP